MKHNTMIKLFITAYLLLVCWVLWTRSVHLEPVINTTETKTEERVVKLLQCITLGSNPTPMEAVQPSG